MLYRLISVCIISHIHYLHFTYFMNHSPIIAIIKNRRKNKYRIQHFIERVFSPHQINQPLSDHEIQTKYNANCCLL